MAPEPEEDYAALQERVTRAVSREDRSRRVALALFLLLLLVPFGVGAFVLMRGSTEREWVRQQAASAATSEIEALKPALDDVQRLGAALPDLEAQVGRIGELERRQRAALRSQEEEWSRAVAQIREEALPALERRHEAHVAELEAQLRENTAVVARVERVVQAAPGRGVRAELDEIQARLNRQAEAIERFRAQRTRPDRTTRELGELRERLTAMEARVADQAELAKRVGKLETTLSTRQPTGTLHRTPTR